MISVPRTSSSPRRTSLRRLVTLLCSLLVLATASLQLGCVVGGGGGQHRGGSTQAATGGPSGTWHQDLGAGASVDLPKRPNEERELERLSDGSRVTINRYTTAFSQANFLIATTNVDGGVGGNLFGFLEGMLDGFLRSADGMEVVSSDAIWLQGHPGTSFELRNETGRRIVVRQFVGRSRAYTFAFAAPQSAEGSYTAAERAFFDSIRLAHGDAPSPAGDGQLDFTRFQWIYPPEGGFAAELPGVPSRRETQVRFGDEDYTAYVYETRNADGSAGMLVRTIDVGGEDQPEDLLTQLQTQVAGDGAVVRGARPAQRQGFGGQAFLVEGATSLRYVVQVVTPTRVIEMVHTVPRGDEAGQADNRRRFFNSLRIF